MVDIPYIDTRDNPNGINQFVPLFECQGKRCIGVEQLGVQLFPYFTKIISLHMLCTFVTKTNEYARESGRKR